MTLFGGEPTAGTPTTPEDTAGEVSVRAVVEQAVRFMPSGLVIPGGMGQGEGPS
ncbi:MAG: hypothetical protein QOC78_1577, partial [Solirubrobacteraceae bacterium]|nr:hypothetical protein [Solirubrobacteraceae bacterium]